MEEIRTITPLQKGCKSRLPLPGTAASPGHCWGAAILCEPEALTILAFRTSCSPVLQLHSIALFCLAHMKLGQHGHASLSWRLQGSPYCWAFTYRQQGQLVAEQRASKQFRSSLHLWHLHASHKVAGRPGGCCQEHGCKGQGEQKAKRPPALHHSTWMGPCHANEDHSIHRANVSSS